MIQKINDKQAAIGKMMATIKHRGPSSDGYYTNDEVALGFRRLSIIDLRCGSQPIYNEDKTRAIIFNGEIYNFKPLRSELIEKGHTFTTKPIRKFCFTVMKNGEWMAYLSVYEECLLSLSGMITTRLFMVHVTSLVLSQCITLTKMVTY